MHKQVVTADGQTRSQDRNGNDLPLNNLPVQMTPLIGRQDELAILKPMLLRADVPLLTLTGPGGIGKTRLALRLAAELTDDFADGVWLVTLAPLRDPALALPSIAQTLGIAGGAEGTLLERLRAHLRPKQLLLALDNFEHLLPAAPVVTELLTACPYLKVLVTSRAPLRLSGEHEYLVPPLSIPDAASNDVNEPERLLQYGAVRLFYHRVQAVKASFVLTRENASAVVEVCRRLDGLPLAIELAAARSKLFSPQSLLRRLDKRLELLTRGARDLPERQQTLRSTIDWSHELLSEPEQKLCRCLAVFDGGATLEAVEAVYRALDELPNVVDTLASVVDQNLVHSVETPEGEVRFGLLETVREYALEKLCESGEEGATRQAHARYFLRLAEEVDAHVDESASKRWNEQLEAEHNNLRAALRWSINSRDIELALRLARVLAGFWEHNAHLREGRAWLDQVLALEVQGDEFEAQRASIYHDAALLATRQSDWQAAAALAEESVRLYRLIGDEHGAAHALLTLALIATMQNDYARSVELHQQLLPTFERLGDPAGLARATHNFGLAHRFEKPHEALKLGERSLGLYQQAKRPRGVVQARNLIGWAHLNLRNTANARESFEQSLKESRQLQLRWVAAYVLQGLSDTVRLQGQTPLAVKLCSASEALFRSLGVPSRQVRLEEHFHRLVSDLRAALDDASFKAAWAEGQTITLESIIEALERHSPPDTTTDTRGPQACMRLAGLTRRELEVLQQLATGRSDKKIADVLGLSPGTVSKHVANILGKTGLKNRTTLALWALEHGLKTS